MSNRKYFTEEDYKAANKRSRARSKEKEKLLDPEFLRARRRRYEKTARLKKKLTEPTKQGRRSVYNTPEERAEGKKKKCRERYLRIKTTDGYKEERRRYDKERRARIFKDKTPEEMKQHYRDVYVKQLQREGKEIQERKRPSKIQVDYETYRNDRVTQSVNDGERYRTMSFHYAVQPGAPLGRN
jgi:hypothetical protein